ncbi:MAG: tRNA pseudouridine(38-40) synthase TruA [Gilvibacter sp.]
MRYFIQISFKGTHYHGWQRQPNANTVQQEIENCLTKLLKSEISIMGAGRTDTGVHAKQLFAHFDSDEIIDIEHLLFKINNFLPKDIAVKKLFRVKDKAHARFDATSRTYMYYVSLAKDPFTHELNSMCLKDVDVAAMNNAAQLLIGKHDFECFARAHSDVKTFFCDVRKASWVQKEQMLIFTITADRFLRNMVRAVVGTLLNVGLGRTSLDQFKAIMASKDRSKAGASASAAGLFLTQVTYLDEIKDYE